nr:DUF4185 domain-containing protein [Kofleriaceae bacterium]
MAVAWGAVVAACGAPSGAGAAGDARGSADAGGRVDSPAPLATPQLTSLAQQCKLLDARFGGDPTANDVQHRANMFGADLGITVAAPDALYIFFGDTIGFAGIWGDGQSHPDAVGRAASADALCSALDIVTLTPQQSIGPTVDATVAADFAGGAMTPPAGHALSEFIHNPSGGGGTTFANLPGDFEVPSGAFAANGAIYVFYTTVRSPTDTTMVGSYLARWDAPATSAIPSYQIVEALGLGGDFINVAAATDSTYVYLFGTGTFRASPVSLARKRLDALDTPGGYERFDAATGAWTAAQTGAAPIIATAGYGETSVRYVPGLDAWMFLAEELTPTANRVVARFARVPEGPWSDPVVVADMADAGWRAGACCAVDDDCQGTQFLDCDRTGFYGAYLLPEVDADLASHTLTAAFTLSSFAPYGVALYRATFELKGL